MKEAKEELVKSTKGITLIALIVTVIVLLILAGITINLTIGQDGILKRTEGAGKNCIDAKNYEENQLAEFTNDVDKIITNVTRTKVGKLTEIITGDDYGKNIDYKVTVKNTNNENVMLSNWKVFYNDKEANNVYIILDGYLDNSLIPVDTKTTTKGKYEALWRIPNGFTNNDIVLEVLTNETYWENFAEGIEGAVATATPTYEMLEKSWNENPVTSSKNFLTVGQEIGGLRDTTRLYFPYTDKEEECWGYWLATKAEGETMRLWVAEYTGYIGILSFEGDRFALRPVVCLPSGTSGKIGNSITID